MADKKDLTKAVSDNDMSIEAGFERLAEIKKAMEASSVSLDDAFKLYKEGIELIKSCNDKLDKTEKQVKIIAADGRLDDFDDEE